LNFGAPGLVLATVGVNLITCFGLLLALQRRVPGMPLANWARDSALLLAAALVAGLIAWATAHAIGWPQDLLGLVLQCSFSGGLGLLVYGLIAGGAKVPEALEIGRQLRARLPGRG